MFSDPMDSFGISVDENNTAGKQKAFFEFSGPVYKIKILPAKATIPILSKKKLKLAATDKAGRSITTGIDCVWTLFEGPGQLTSTGEFAEFIAGEEPAVSWIIAEVKTPERELTAECLITSTAELGSAGQINNGNNPKKGLPNYTFINAPGELWRSRYRITENIIEINKGHADFIFAARINKRKLRYIARLFVKEIILFNFPELSKEELLERMTELLLYMEENL